MATFRMCREGAGMNLKKVVAASALVLAALAVTAAPAAASVTPDGGRCPVEKCWVN
jgi:hypothetical protein